MQEKESQGKKRLNYTVAALAAALGHRYVAAPRANRALHGGAGGKRLGATLRGGIRL